ncbi:MAG: sigma-70 family RNA polymerase sigma factor [Bacteroidetes bacterium]|nr:sigma-70 family RNA polymerase sigma factor [Bacteroidota bacterium]
MTQIEFNHAVQSQYKPLRGYAMKLAQDVENANDLVQETMLKAFKNKDKFTEGTNLKGWLYTIMKNIFINQYRRMVNSNIFTDDTENQYYINSLSNSGNNGAESRLAMRDIQSAIESLNENLKKPFMMSFEGYKYEEIAQHLSIPLGTVKIRIHNARQKLQDSLKTYGMQLGLSKTTPI